MRVVLKQVAVLLGGVLIAGGVTYGVRGAPKRVFICDKSLLKEHEVCLADVMADDKGLVWVDARHRVDWQENRVKGAILWNLDKGEDMLQFEQDGAAAIWGAKRVVVYCTDEQCGLSHAVAGKIRTLDLCSRVEVLKGGWRALQDWDRYQEKKLLEKAPVSGNGK